MIETIFGADIGTGIFILINIIVIESLLSVDNSAVLAVMVKDLPPEQKGKALKYGIIGAYVLRGACLLLASYLVKILWLKIAGGLYLCYLAYDFFKQKNKEEDGKLDKEENWFYKKFKGVFGAFWTTVILVELVDLTFSIDNIFAVVAFTDNIYLICIGVFVGILAMRFVAQRFVVLIEKYPTLEKITFIVIALLGIKLTLSGICDYIPNNFVSPILNHHNTDIIFSAGILLLFLFPVFFKRKVKA